MARPGATVEIRDADTEALLGSATAGTGGYRAVTIAAALTQAQRIYP